jgi:hypothetical protein
MKKVRYVVRYTNEKGQYRDKLFVGYQECQSFFDKCPYLAYWGIQSNEGIYWSELLWTDGEIASNRRIKQMEQEARKSAYSELIAAKNRREKEVPSF